MSQKFVHKVSPELTDDAQYKSVSEIASSALTRGTTILMYPGTYDAISASWDDIAIVGMGDKDDVVINGLTLSNTAANTVTIKNVTINGSDANAAGEAAAITAGSADDAGGTVEVHLIDVALGNAEFGIVQHGAAGGVTIERSDLTGVDQAVVSNANATINFSILNTSSNAYFAHGGGNSDGDATVTVTASHSGGSNTGSTIETVRALVS